MSACPSFSCSESSKISTLVSARAVHAVGSPEPPPAASPSMSPTGPSVMLLTHRTSTGEQLCRVQWPASGKGVHPPFLPLRLLLQELSELFLLKLSLAELEV